VFSSSQFLAEVAQRIRQLALQQMDDKRDELMQMTQRLARVHPRRRLEDWLQRLDDAQTSLLRCTKQGTRRLRVAWQTLGGRLSRVSPALVLRQKRELLLQVERRLHEQVRLQVARRKNGFAALEARLRLLGPEQVL